MTEQSGAPTDSSSTSGIQYIKFAASGRNRFVTWIALLAALGGFLFGYDTGIIGQALPFVQKQFHAGAITASWIVASVLLGAIVGAACSGYLADRISRKWTRCLSGCVFVAGADPGGHRAEFSVDDRRSVRARPGGRDGVVCRAGVHRRADTAEDPGRHGQLQPADDHPRHLARIHRRIRSGQRQRQLAVDGGTGRAATASVLISMLPGPLEVHAAMLGEAGALTSLAAGATWIDMSSNSPTAARPVQEQAMRRGVEVLEAPVGGGISAARAGTLQLFVGGETNVVEKHREMLEILGDPGRIVHVGGHGAGYTVKLLVNLLWFGQAVATAEALLLGQRAGIDPAVLQHALTGSAAASTFIRSDIGLAFRGDYLASFGLDRMCEELDAVTALAGDYQVPWELSEVVRRTYHRALTRFGPTEGELLAVSLLEDEAGDKLRAAPS